MLKWYRSAAYRIAFGYSAAFAAGVLLLGVAVFFVMHAAFVRQLDQRVTEEARFLAGEFAQDEPGELADAIALREKASPPHVLFYAVYAPSGKRLYGVLDAGRSPLGLHRITFRDEKGEPDAGRAFALALPNGNRLVVVGDSDAVEKNDATVVAIFSAAFLALVMLGLSGGWFLGSYLRRRLEAIQLSAQAISAGDMNRRIAVSGRDDEFDRLSATLNTMLERIARLLENLRQVSSDIAHDLRSPLARLRNSLEGALSDLSEDDAATPILRGAIVRVDDILSLFAAILRVSEIESGKMRARFEPIDLSAIATEIAESYAPAIAEDGRKLAWSIADDVVVCGDAELVAQAISNLLENAQIHTPEGTSINLSLAQDELRAILKVVDNGPGVSVADRPRIAERFVRLDSSRHLPGHGLGLNLVAAIARLHDAGLEFEDAAPGLAVMLKFARFAA